MSNPKPPPSPAPRSETVRQTLLEELRRGAATAWELSTRLGLRERDVTPHLEHLARSLRARGERLSVAPAHCLRCGYAFDDRRSLAKPSRCPECRGERIEAPRFRVDDDGG
ncbi:transcriptional regulator [Sorangium sp. So ce260]|uniref:transcriptional regulator n=1 Tax=Sorangium sp. So ce260 TaxID=3133291 RepID=UPI003F621E2D